MKPRNRLRLWVGLLALGSIALNVALIARRAPAARGLGGERDPRLSDYRYVLERMRRENAPHEVLSWMAFMVEHESRTSSSLYRFRSNSIVREVLGIPPGESQQQMFRDVGKSDRNREAELVQLRREFGPLPDDRLRRLEAARQAAREEANRRRESSDASVLTRFRELLTPEEFTDYLHFNSAPAKSLKRILNPVEITEAEYFTLVDAALAREAVSPGTGEPANLTSGMLHNGQIRLIQGGGGLVDRQFALSVLREFHQVLGDDSFLTVAGGLSARPASLGEAYRKTSLSPATRVERFFRAQEFEWAYNAVMRPRSGPSEAERWTTLRPAAIEARRDLTAGLSPAEIADFEKTPFGAKLKEIIAGK